MMRLVPPAILILTLCSCSALAAEAVLTELEAPRIFQIWVKPDGRTEPAEFNLQSRWIFRDDLPQFPHGQLLLRMEIEVPDDEEFLQGDPTSGNKRPKAGVFIFPGPSPGRPGHVIYHIESMLETTPLRIERKTREGKRVKPGPEAHSGLILNRIETSSRVWIHPSCRENGVRFRPGRATTQATLGVRCLEARDGRLDWVILNPTELELEVPKGFTIKQKGDGWVRIAGAPPPPAARASQAAQSPERLGELRLAQRGQGALQRGYFTMIAERETRSDRPWYGSAGLGATYLDYKEGAARTLGAFALTFKGLIGYRFLPSRWDFNVSGFINAYTGRLGGDLSSTMRLYGVNGRVGYRLPVTWWGNARWTIYGGYYLWGLLDSANSYRLRSLQGSQLFLTVSRPNAARPYSLYLKFAPLSEAGNFTPLRDRELAIGGAVALSTSPARRDWSLTLDLSQSHSESARPGNVLDLVSASIGVQRQF